MAHRDNVNFAYVNPLRPVNHGDQTTVVSSTGSWGGRSLLGWRLLCFSFQLPLFFLLLFLGDLSLTLSERIVGFGHMRSSSVGFRVKVNYAATFLAVWA